MTVLGVNMTDKDSVKGWEAVRPVARHRNPLLDYSERAYKLAGKMVDTGENQDEIDLMNDLGKVLQDLAREGAECSCGPRDNGSCKVCKAVSTLFYVEEAYPWG